MGQWLSSLFGGSPERDNPTLADIQARQEAEEAQKRAEKSAQDAKDLAQAIKDQADKDREQALARQEEADKAAARAAEETQRMKTQMEEAAKALRRAEELAQEATKAAKEEGEKLAREAKEERERSQKLREDAEKAIQAVKEEAERAQKVADEQRQEAEAGKALAEEVARAAADETKKAMEAKEDAEKRLKEGIQPVVTPSPEEVAAAKRRVQYKEDRFHFAIAGVSGSGKSSLVNAFRGLRSRDGGAAAVGVTETTMQMTRYADANPGNPYVWYDIPGAGTIKCRDWQYFNDQGLYVFDCIIVLFDNRFTMTDVAILVNARRFNIPTYIVRSKADQHIRNVMMDMGYDSEGDDEEDVERRNKLHKAARKQFIDRTRKSVKANLEDANLPDQRVYIVSNTTLLSLVLNKMPKKTIDEVEFLNDLINEAHTRRKASFNNESTLAVNPPEVVSSSGTYQMADEARARIDEEMRNLRGRRNALSPICRLPSEQLAAIFIHCALDHHCKSSHIPIKDIPGWVNLSYICRHWRNVALDCPILWTYHFVLSLRWTEELLARSKQASLKIRITFAASKPNSWWSNLMKRLVKHVKRIQELHLDFPDKCISHILSKLSSPAPRLQDLKISVNRGPSEWASVLFQGDTQALCTLRLSNCPVPWYLFKLSALTTLHLEQIPDRFRQSTEEFLATLNYMQDLKHLYLKDALTSAAGFLSSAAFSTSSKINLCYLSRLLILAPLSTVTALVSCVNIPGKTEVRLECTSEANSSLDDFTLLSSALARRFSISEDQALSCLTVRSLTVESSQFGRACLTFSALEHDCDSSITISDMEWGRNIPLKVVVYFDESRVGEDVVLSDMCCCMPLTGIETFWRKTLEHLQNLRYLKLSRGDMPDLASILSHSDLTIRGAVENRVGDAPSGHILVPRLEKLVLYRVDFASEEADSDSEAVVTRRRLFDALSTRYAPQGRLILIQCTVGVIDGLDMVHSWDGIISYEDIS
ncbi:hypothetical protein EV363DRAFT_1394360 [Boletus edulis]|nr:hypothetical protein EV363DRAFT_1394360 [Boletus edulis]